MSAADAAKLHRTMFAAIERRNLDALRALFAVDASHTSPDGEPVIGAEPVIAEVSAFVEAFPDSRSRSGTNTYRIRHARSSTTPSAGPTRVPSRSSRRLAGPSPSSPAASWRRERG
jgi:ketosteroid isomerase-like protein